MIYVRYYIILCRFFVLFPLFYSIIERENVMHSALHIFPPYIVKNSISFLVFYSIIEHQTLMMLAKNQFMEGQQGKDDN